MRRVVFAGAVRSHSAMAMAKPLAAWGRGRVMPKNNFKTARFSQKNIKILVFSSIPSFPAFLKISIISDPGMAYLFAIIFYVLTKRELGGP